MFILATRAFSSFVSTPNKVLVGEVAPHGEVGFGARIFVLVGLVADKLEGMEEETTGG